MKKAMSKLLSAVLIMALVFTSGGMVFADTGSAEDQMKAETAAAPQAAGEVSAAEISQDLEKQAKAASAKSAATAKAGSLSYITMTTGNEVPKASVFGYTSTSNVVASGKAGMSKRIYLPAKGTFIIAVYNGPDSTNSIYFGLFRNAQMTSAVDYSIASRGNTNTYIVKVPSAGYYYMGVYSSFYGSTPVAVAGSMAAGYVSGADRTVYSGRQIAVGQKNGQTNYFKFKAIRNGYLRVQSSEGYDKVTLYNSTKKKALSNATSTHYAPTYGVKKGRTYYVRVVSGYNSDGGYNLKVTNTAIKEKSGKKKSKAVLIKKKKTKKGTIVAGEKRTDWYKFKVTKKKRVRVIMKGATNDQLKVVIYKGKRRVGSGTFGYYSEKLTLKSLGKLSKGTYHIKVYRGNKKSSGWYSLSWR